MTTIYRKDYKPYPFEVPTVHLDFELDEDRTTVTALSRFKQKPGCEGAPLVLLGHGLELVHIKIDGELVASDRYTIKDEELTIADVPDAFLLEVKTSIVPSANTEGKGLWYINGECITQCEPEGFRRIVYSPDRPDVLSVVTTTIVTDRRKFPVLLSNGNLLSQTDQELKRIAIWHDPFPKPTYLYALVAGDLHYIEAKHVTSPSGREVTIRVYAAKKYIESGECDHALRAIIKAMKWDEEHFGREYDLDLFMVYVSPTFNMGAMENKGLNIFNMKYVLALPQTATDRDYELIEAVIAHEYFHNWSGDRVTVRDWFQLSLKEGFTVYRDSRFSRDFRGLPKIIEDVKTIRTVQFTEDAGPMAHPIRIDEAQSVENFYSATIYEKGAEVIRMMEVILGLEKFRKACDLYFERHDGQAVTCEDFIKAMEDGGGVDLTQFRHWYSYAGTPTVGIEFAQQHDGTYLLTVTQSCPPTPGQSEKPAFHIPFVIGFVGESGDIAVSEDSGAYDPATGVLHVTKMREEFVIRGLKERPVLSLNRRFAPVKVAYTYGEGDLEKLVKNDTDPFCKWDAWNTLARKSLLARINGGAEDPAQQLSGVFGATLHNDTLTLDLKRALIVLPAEEELANDLKELDPVLVHDVREGVMASLADQYRPELKMLYDAHASGDGEVRLDNESIARRALANTALAYLCRGDGADTSLYRAWSQYRDSQGMTDKLAALQLLAHNGHLDAWKREAQDALEDFYLKFAKYPNVVDKWFATQSTNPASGTLGRLRELMKHPAWDIKNPNKVMSLIGGFSMANPVQFHDLSGDGYKFLADFVIELDPINGLIASKRVEPLLNWQRYDKRRQGLMLTQLKRLSSCKLSPETAEKVQKAVEAASA